MKTGHLAGLLGLAAITAPGAAGQVYAGVGYTQFKTGREAAFQENTYTLGATTARLGYQVGPFFAVEGEYSFGVEGDMGTTMGLSPSIPVTEAPIDLDKQYGVFAVGRLPVPVVGALFARVGFSHLAVDSGLVRDFIGDDQSGSAFGAGVELPVFSLVRARAEYTHYKIDEGYDALSFTGLVKF
jgi:hypothetical protein